jgi:hypothetical protein
MGVTRFTRVVAIVGLALLSACSSDDGTLTDKTVPAGVSPGGETGGQFPGTGGYTPGTAGFTPGTSGQSSGTGGFSLSAGGFSPSTGGMAEAGGATFGRGGAIIGVSSGGAGGGAGGTSGAANTGGASEGSGGGAPVEKPPCLGNPNQLVMIGDSYMNWVSHTFGADMNAAAGMTIENFAIGGTSMGSGGIGLIAPQFTTALATHPNPLAVIMDGGGNDVLVPDTVQFPQGGQCKMLGTQSPSIPDCQKIVEKALAAGTELFVRMAGAGVKDVMFFFYPHVPVNTLVGGTDPNGMLDYAIPKIKAACDGAHQLSLQLDPTKTIRCHFIDMVPVFAGHPEYFAPTDIHPNTAGSKAMAAAIWAQMKQDCVAQPASSGCCTP